MSKTMQLADYAQVDKLLQDVDDLSKKWGSGGSSAASAFSSTAAAHNGIFRGKDLTNEYTIDEICKMVSDGTFEDLYIGDYITVTISTSLGGSEDVDVVFADFNTYLHKGDTELTQNHITCVPKDCFKTTAKMNSSSTTSGGYKGTAMHQTTLPIYATALQSALNNHLISHNVLMSSATGSNASIAGAGYTGNSSSWEWVSTYLCLMDEVELYGSRVFSSSFYDMGERNRQFNLFKLAPEYMVARQGKGGSRCTFWLSAVASSTSFAYCDSNGGADHCLGASASFGVRPSFLIG
jgi:hypothetical protein